MWKKDPMKGKPTRKIVHIQANKAAEAAIEQHGEDITYQVEYERYINRREILEANLSKAYALIYDTYCNKTMQNRIEESTDFESKIRNDLIELLKMIKIIMHYPARAKYPYASLSKHIVDLVNMQQNDNESLTMHPASIDRGHFLRKNKEK